MQSVEAELRLSYPRKTFSALNLKIKSETWGRHESSGDRTSCGSHSFQGLKIVRYLHLLNPDLMDYASTDKLKIMTTCSKYALNSYIPSFFADSNDSRHCIMHKTYNSEIQSLQIQLGRKAGSKRKIKRSLKKKKGGAKC